MAQQMLIERQDKAAVPHLEQSAAAASARRRGCTRCARWTAWSALREDTLTGRAGRCASRRAAARHPLERAAAGRLAERARLAVLKLHRRSRPAGADATGLHAGRVARSAAATVLAAMLLRPDLDRFQRAAAYSSLNEKNLEAVLTAVIRHAAAEPPAELLKTLLGLAASYKNEPALVRGLDLIATPRDGKYAAWQVAALTGLLDSLGPRKALARQARPAVRRKAERRTQSRRGVCSSIHARPWPSPMRPSPSGCWPPGSWAAVPIGGRKTFNRWENCSRRRRPARCRRPWSMRLGGIDDKQTPAVLLANWKAHGPQLRGRILDVLAARSAGQQALVEALKRGDVKAADIDTARRQQLLARLERRRALASGEPARPARSIATAGR